jgi:hypothetical protein
MLAERLQPSRPSSWRRASTKRRRTICLAHAERGNHGQIQKSVSARKRKAAPFEPPSVANRTVSVEGLEVVVDDVPADLPAKVRSLLVGVAEVETD